LACPPDLQKPCDIIKKARTKGKKTMKRLPIGIQDYKNMVENDYLYDLVNSGEDGLEFNTKPKGFHPAAQGVLPFDLPGHAPGSTGGVFIKLYQYIPNTLSVLRIILSFFLFFLIDHRMPFVYLYSFTGLTDFLDGYIARKLGVESDLGAKLDSVADFVFYIILLFIFIRRYPELFTMSYRWLIIGIVFVRLFNLFITKLKYKRFVFVHTIGNKMSGILIFLLPIILLFEQPDIFLCIILGIAFLAATEELLITILYPEPKLNRRSIFCQ